MTDPTGVRESDEAVDAAASSVPAHPSLKYNVEQVLRGLGLPESLEVPLSNNNNHAILTFVANNQAYRFSFHTSDTVGYIITFADVVRALRGEVESVRNQRGAACHVMVTLPFPSASAEERAAARARFADFLGLQEVRAAAQHAENEARRAAWVKAEMRARETLQQFLTPAQRTEMDTQGYFTIVGSAGTHFRIHTLGGVSGNVQWVDNRSNPQGMICGHCRVSVPRCDHYLTQLLEITYDERAWLKIAHPCGGEMPPTMVQPW
jgi:hypothetical protein